MGKNEAPGVWQMVLEASRAAHAAQFPGRRFGTDQELMLLLGGAVANHVGQKPINASKLAAYMDMPRETVRRHLAALVGLGLMTRHGTAYRPTPKALSSHADMATKLIRKTAAIAPDHG